MASSCEASCISDPNFAVICAFLERFASSCGIEYPTFVDLQEMLENVDQVPQELIDLHIKLLRKARKTVFIEKWERALIKFCHTYSSQDGWEIERFGYKKSRLEVKIRVLKMLLEGQFDLNQKFKAQINTIESGELRTKPLGKDKVGRLYWLQTDPVSNIRVYREDLDDESWTLVAKDRPSLVELLQELSGEESPAYLNLLNEDSVSLDVDKPVTDTGQNENGSIKGEEDNEKIGVNGEVNSDAQEQPINSEADKEPVNGCVDKEGVNGNAQEEPEVGEVIEEPVMYITGEGAGADCDAGNPDKEEEQNERVEESAPNTSEHDLPSEKQKPTPKLWSIDTICGVNSTEMNEVKHKNFSSFSIDSVLEKKDSEATFSKYTVNCPFESNSVGGEPTSDVNLKTDINSDVVPYREASNSEPILTSSDDINSIKSISETADNVHSLVVESNSEVPPASSKADAEVSKKLEDTVCEEAKSDAPEIPVENESPDETSSSVLNKNQSNSQTNTNSDANSLKDCHIENQTEEIIKSPLTETQSSEIQPSIDEEKESPIDKKTEGGVINQQNTAKEFEQPITVIEPALDENNLKKEVKDILSEEKKETVEVPKPVDEKIELKTLNVPEIPIEKEKVIELPSDTQTEKKLENQSITTAEEPSFTKIVAESPVTPETSNSVDVLEQDSSEKIPEEIEERKKTETTDETKTLEVAEDKLEPEEIVSSESKAEESEILIQQNVKKDSQKELEDKTDHVSLVELKLEKMEEQEVKEVQLPAEANFNPMEIESEKHENLQEVIEKKDSEIIEKKAVSEGEKEAEKVLSEEIEITEDKKRENDDEKKDEEKEKELQETPKAAEEEENNPAVDEVIIKPEITLQTEESEKEKLVEELPIDAKPEDVVETDRKTPEKMDDEKDAKQDEKNENTESRTGVKDKEEKKLKRELVVAIEKMESVPDINKESEKEADNEKLSEDKATPRKLTRSSAKAKESEVEKEEEKGTKEEESDKPKKEKKELRRLSRNRRGVEESSIVEETPRMTRGRRKSVGLEETPKQTKGRRGRGKAKEEETEKEVKEEKEEEKVESDKVENKSEEEEGEENGKEIETQKPQARRGRKPKNRRRRFFNFQRKKVHEENEKEHEKKGGEEKKNDDEKKEEGEDKEKKENEEKKERKRRRKRDEATLLRDRAAAELKLLEVTEDAETPSTIRQSRRIAQIKLKEEAERRRVEALQLESFKNEKNKKGKKKRKSKHDSDSGDEERPDKDEEDSDDEIPKKERKRRKKKDKLKFNELNPWLSSTESSTVDEEEEELDDEPHEDDELVFKSDHEFSPESDVEDPDYKPIKRARTAKVEESEEKGGKYDDTACEKCGNKDHPEWILLCDKCDKGWHASCVRPALMVVPEGDWFCPPCEHIFLIEKLKESLAQYDKSQKQRENEELRRKRLAFVGISLDNVLPPAKKISKEDNEDDEKSASESHSESESSESDSGSSDSSEPVYQLRERRSNVTSYRYNEYDELIKSALKDEIEAVKGAGNAGRGKDISNIVNAERQKENEKPEKEEDEGENLPVKEQDGNEEEKPKEKSKKDEDGDYDVETEEEEEDDENIADEIPPVVPKNTGLKKKKSKSVKITSLDFTSEEEDNNSDSDFKGTSDEEESECSLPSESESSEEIGRRRKGFDGPVRRSTRARVSRYDRDFINDDSSDDDEPKRKRQRSWDSTESSDSDRSWGRKKRKKGGISNRAKRFSSEKKKKKKQKRRVLNSDDDEEHRPAKKSKSRKIIYGGLDEEPILTRRTRGKKINYQEMNGSDSEDEQPRKTARVIESDDDFVAENDKDEEAQNAESEEIESGVDEDEDTDPDRKKKPEEKKKKILEKIKKKKWVIPDPDDFSEDDLMEEKQLDELNEELEDLDDEEEEILGNILEKGDVPINELRDAVKRAKEERKKKKETEIGKGQPETLLPRTYPPIPAHMEFGGGKFPKIGKVKITPSRAELASMGGIPPQGGLPGPGAQPGFNASGFPTPDKQEEKPEMLLRTLPGEKGLGDPNIPTNHSKPDQRPYPYPMEAPPAGPLTMMAMMNSQKGDDSPVGAKNGPPHYSYQGMAGYPPNIPTTVMGISDIEAQGKKKPGPKPGTKMKKKIDDGDDNAASGDEFKMESVKAVRGRVKKPEEGVSTVQPPSQFPPADGGSVITRMLNAPQYESNQFALRNPPFRPIHFPTPPRPPPPIRVRVPGPMFHTSHPHDPSPSGGGPINIPTTKPSPPSPTFNRAPVPIIQRFPDPRFNVQGSPSRPEFPAYGNYYGNFPQPEEPGFQNPPSYPEQFPEGAPPPPKPFEDETGGEFGGLASYFASQREEDLDT